MVKMKFTGEVLVCQDTPDLPRKCVVRTLVVNVNSREILETTDEYNVPFEPQIMRFYLDVVDCLPIIPKEVVEVVVKKSWNVFAYEDVEIKEVNVIRTPYPDYKDIVKGV